MLHVNVFRIWQDKSKNRLLSEVKLVLASVSPHFIDNGAGKLSVASKHLKCTRVREEEKIGIPNE